MTSPSPARCVHPSQQRGARSRRTHPRCGGGDRRRSLDALKVVGISPSGPPSPRHAVPVLRPRTTSSTRWPNGSRSDSLDVLEASPSWTRRRLRDGTGCWICCSMPHRDYRQRTGAAGVVESGRGSIRSSSGPTTSTATADSSEHRRRCAMAEAKVPRDELSTMIYVCWEASQALLEPLFAATPTVIRRSSSRPRSLAALPRTGVRAGRTGRHDDVKRSTYPQHSNVTSTSCRQCSSRARRSGLELDAARIPVGGHGCSPRWFAITTSRAAACTSPAVARRSARAACGDPPDRWQHRRPSKLRAAPGLLRALGLRLPRALRLDSIAQAAHESRTGTSR